MEKKVVFKTNLQKSGKLLSCEVHPTLDGKYGTFVAVEEQIAEIKATEAFKRGSIWETNLKSLNEGMEAEERNIPDPFRKILSEEELLKVAGLPPDQVGIIKSNILAVLRNWEGDFGSAQLPEQSPEKTETEPEDAEKGDEIPDYDSVTKADLIATLDEKGIAHDPKALKEELYKLAYPSA